MELPVGTRVRLRRDAERYPHFIAPAGRLGTVVGNDEGLVRVRLDLPLAGAEEWSNEVHWFDELVDDCDEDLEVVDASRTYLVLRYDVTDLPERERDALAGEASVQAEASDDHRDAPHPTSIYEGPRDPVASVPADLLENLLAVVCEFVLEGEDESNAVACSIARDVVALNDLLPAGLRVEGRREWLADLLPKTTS